MVIRRPLLFLFGFGIVGGAIAFGLGLSFNPGMYDYHGAPNTRSAGAMASTAPTATIKKQQPDGGSTNALVPRPTSAIHTATVVPELLAQAVKGNDGWCAIANLPSSLVICADPELRTIAEERGKLYRRLKLRLDRAQRELLDAGQRSWIKTYATNCGVPPNVAPHLPPSPEVLACFKRAGLARNEYLLRYRPIIEGEQDVPLQSTNGVETIPVLVNGMLPLQFVVDSGASVVVLPRDVVLTLIRTGSLTKEDFIGSEKAKLADGTIIDSIHFYIRELRVGAQVVTHVAAAMAPNTNADPLLGQSFLTNFASWSLDNNRRMLVLHPLAASVGDVHRQD